jgi:NitT/TauT family transport system permease protein
VLRIFAMPNRTTAFALSWLLFAAGIIFYLRTSHTRHLENPDDRIVPTIQQLAGGFWHAAMTPADDDTDTVADEHAPVAGQFLNSMLWKDTKASGGRFLFSLALMLPAVILGLHMGSFPWIGSFFTRFFLFFDKIIALSILPILFIAFGIGQAAKIMLIVIGVAPTIILDTLNLAKSVPPEQVIKGFTLGAKDLAVTYRVMLPQIWPRVLNSIRLNLKAIALFLFAGEMIASTDGLAYRIALLQRHMGMDLIIPYVLWVALLLFLVDAALRVLIRWMNPWFREI